jgi:hypothetical protein
MGAFGGLLKLCIEWLREPGNAVIGMGATRCDLDAAWVNDESLSKLCIWLLDGLRHFTIPADGTKRTGGAPYKPGLYLSICG